MFANFYVIDAALGHTMVTVRAYTHRGGKLLTERTFATYAEARDWRFSTVVEV
jgi:hypothetical protein